MTWDEERKVADIVGRLIEYESHCFQSLKEAQDVAKKAGQIQRLWSKAHTIALGHHRMSGYVVRVVSASDGDVCVIFENGDTIPLDVLKNDADHGNATWDAD